MKQDRVTKVVVGAVCIVFVGLIMSYLIIVIRTRAKFHTEMRQRQTYFALENIAIACDKYRAANGHWPSSLSELQNGPPPYPPEWCTDGWGRVVFFAPYSESRGYGKVISYGRDGMPGGDGLDYDFEIRFPFDVNTNWNDEQGQHRILK